MKMTLKNTNVLEFSRSAVRVTPLNTVDGSIQPQTCHEFEWPHEGDISWQAPDEVANWLLNCFRDRGIHVRHAIVCVPRNCVCLRVIELPDCPPDQVPTLVSLQAEASTGEQPNSIEYDFTVLPRVSPTSPQSVLLATISRSTFKGIQDVLQRIDCEPESITLGELAIPFHQIAGDQPLQFFGTMNNSQWDVSVAFHRRTIQIQSAAFTGNEDAHARSITGLVQRLLSAMPASMREMQKEAPLLLWDSDSTRDRETLDQVASALGYSVQTYSRSQCVVRMVRQQETRALDFNSPFRAPNKVALARKRWAMVAAAAAVLTSLLLCWSYLASASNHRKTAMLNAQISKLRQDIADLEPTREAYRSVQEWRDRSMDWGTELSKLAERLTSERDIYISRLQMESGESEQAPTIRIDGLARTSNDVLKLNRDFLKETDRYSIQPQGIEPSITDSEFSSQFRLEAKVLTKLSNANKNLDDSNEEHDHE